MGDYVYGDPVRGEQYTDVQELTRRSWSDKDGQRVISLVTELIDVVDNGVLDLFNRISASQGCIRDPHNPTLVANSG